MGFFVLVFLKGERMGFVSQKTPPKTENPTLSPSSSSPPAGIVMDYEAQMVSQTHPEAHQLLPF